MQQPADCQLADCTNLQVNMLAGTLGVAFAGRSRQQVVEAITTDHPNMDEQLFIRQLELGRLQQWAQALEIDDTPPRGDIAARIYVQGNPPPPAPPPPAPPVAPTEPVPVIPPAPVDPGPAQAVSNPREIKFVEFEDTQDVESWRRFQDDVNAAAEGIQMKGILDNLRAAQNEEARTVILEQCSPLQQQQLVLIKRGIGKAISVGIDSRLRAAISTNATGSSAGEVMNWLQHEVEKVSTATEKVAEERFKNDSWQKAKCSLEVWVSNQRLQAAKIGPSLPAGVPVEHRLRDLIVKNVKLSDPNVGHIVRDFQAHPVTTAGYGVEELVTRLTTHFATAETSGEQQCSTFSAVVTDEREVETLLAESKKKLVTLKKNQKRDLRDKDMRDKRNDDPMVTDDSGFWGYEDSSRKGKGKGKGKHKGGKRDGGGKSDWGKNDWNRVDHKPERYCENCADHYRGLGQFDTRQTAIRSHNKAQCRWNGSPKDDNSKQKKGTVQKEGEKKGKGRKKKGSR